MRIKIRSHDARMLHDNDWRQTGDWLTTLRDDDRANPMSDGHAEPARADHASREDLVETYRAEAAARAAAQAQAAARAEAAYRAEAVYRAQAAARAQAVARAEAAARAEATYRAQAAARAEAAAQAETAARAEAAARTASTERAVIGDELRIPIMWCEMGSCISWHADPAALGEADARVRAIKAGWRIDALGRLACPRCQQSDAGFWATHSVVAWDRHTAIARASGSSGHNTGTGRSHDPGSPVRGRPYVEPPNPPWHRSAPPLPAPRRGSGPILANYPPRAIR